MRRAVYPGSFDPVTNGHIDVIQRARPLVDELIVAVVRNPNKEPLFTIEERQVMIEQSLGNLDGVRTDSFTGLLVDFVHQSQAQLIVKGLRALSDFEFEFQMAMLNRDMAPDVDTVFLMTSVQHAFLSSSSVKEIASLGGQVQTMVPPCVHRRLQEKYGFSTKPERGQKVDRD
ncbi:MAG: pantetheine-phosphate adenylyltransferase [Vulcanimicrobiota bacterium]